VPCLLAAVAGILLGLLGVGYQHLVLSASWPEIREPMEKAMEFFAESPNARTAYAIMAIGIAPWVEEFLFRGLLFRALLPQWGLGLAVVGSSAFFAIFHPALAWPLVFSVGALNAWLFVRTRSLIPCIVLHACYNAVVIGVELISRYLDWSNRHVAVLFGDGAAAVVVQATDRKEGVVGSVLGCDAEARQVLRVRGIGCGYAGYGVTLGDTV